MRGPSATPIFDAAGNLYGTTAIGGGEGNEGTVFELTPAPGGGWTEQLLYSFSVQSGDGWMPLSNLIFDTAGNLYGTTQYGGSYEGGTVFELKKNGAGGWTESLLHSLGFGSDGHWPVAGLTLDAAGNRPPARLGLAAQTRA